FDPEEAEEERMLLIWDFAVDRVLTETVTPQQPRRATRNHPSGSIAGCQIHLRKSATVHCFL
ncbi:hypothetical protein OS493_039540, partial [Desmophyllum pertusum]